MRDGEEHDGRVLSEALRLLALRPRTAAELRGRLVGAGHAADAVEDCLERLHAGGQLDDRALALHFIVTRAERLGHGPRRLLEALVGRGVDEEVAAAAWRQAVEQGDVDPDALLRGQLRRRVGAAARLDARLYRRVYNALFRAGFEAAAVRAALEAHGGFPETEDESP